MGQFRPFVKSMFSELVSGLTGVASIPFTVAALWVSSHVQRVLYGSLAGSLLLFSAYRVWLKEHLELEKEKAKNQKPDLRGEILETLIGVCTPASEPPLCASVVLLSVKVWNAIQMPSFCVYRYELEVTVNSPEGPRTFTGTRGGWSVSVNVNGQVSFFHMAQEELQPMRYLDSQKGVIAFYVSGLPPETNEFISVVLTLVDALGGRHPITLKNGRFLPNGVLAQKITA